MAQKDHLISLPPHLFPTIDISISFTGIPILSPFLSFFTVSVSEVVHLRIS